MGEVLEDVEVELGPWTTLSWKTMVEPSLKTADIAIGTVVTA